MNKFYLAPIVFIILSLLTFLVIFILFYLSFKFLISRYEKKNKNLNLDNLDLKDNENE